MRYIAIGVLTILLTVAISAVGAQDTPQANQPEVHETPGKQLEHDGVLITPPPVYAGENISAAPLGGLIAFSLKEAEAHLSIYKTRADWRRLEPELFVLGGITRLEGLVVDREAGDVILIGHAEADDPPVTLDDVVVALRARLIHEAWPVVSIDPPPGLPSNLQPGDLETVRFEGGIENTQFGADLLDADHRLKRMHLGISATGVPRFKSGLDRWTERYRTTESLRNGTVQTRLWFEPIEDRVIVRDDVVELGQMSVGVFSEVLSVYVDNHPIEATTYHDDDGVAFAKDLTAAFDSIASAHPTIARVRGLQTVVAVIAGLERVEAFPSLNYWLHEYAVRKVETLSNVRTLVHVADGSPVALVGGVLLRAIAYNLNSGDVSALGQAVRITRPNSATLTWRFVVGQLIVPLSPNL